MLPWARLKARAGRAMLRPMMRMTRPSRRRALALLAGAAAAPLSPLRAGEAEAVIAVASNFADIARFLAAEYGAGTGRLITIASGSTGKIYAQVKHGAPYDAVMLADQARPRLLEEEGHAVPGARFTYAIGRLALWSPDLSMIGPDGAETLRAGRFDRLAIANPRLAPYGAAARQVLERLGLWEALQDRIATGENIGQTYALVASGAAQLGFVAASQAARGATGSVWPAPAGLHDEIRQDAALLWKGAENPAAKGFLAYLDSGHARGLIRSRGYDVPSAFQ